MPEAHGQTTSTVSPSAPLAETRVWARGSENANTIGASPSISSTLHWGSWQIYDGTVSGRLVGLDYFLARYYSSAQGRFTSPDEFPGGIVDPFTGQQVGPPGPLPYADITDPQTLNKYAYVRNNPLRYVDPDGHEGEDHTWEVVDATFTTAGGVIGFFVGGGGGLVGGGAVGAVAGAGVGALPGAGVGAYVGAATGTASGATTGHYLAKWLDNIFKNDASNSGGTTEENSGEKLTRYGDKAETVERLSEQAAKAEANPKVGIHGVSTTINPKPSLPGGTAVRGTVEKTFKVTNTLGKGHRTVELPKPITQKVVDAFNKLFGL